MMSLWDALRMNMMISYQELVRTFPKRISMTAGIQLSPMMMLFDLVADIIPPK